ncbi:2,3-diaminopropionate biosynthesis protein SbnA [Algoriphagus litoralis]|uniref:2,3-diaminopropionate biosynthesis protein SbnA n=1 Tax=Algoriphagus litoralis TaxID=2202829 RepID=UPI000DB9E959|nr:2,3-diaminopropionate biosynthesis protein SbnA [Algoriphagus litoralis]
MNQQISRPQRCILDCIGNTPLVSLLRLFPDYPVQLYGKLEMFNPGGSIKDRTAVKIITNGIQTGAITHETVIVESTSGNMGVGLARICHYFGLRLILVTDPHLNSLTESILKAFQVELIRVDQEDGMGGYLNSRLQKVQELLERYENSFWPDQYHNPQSPLAHRETYREILESLGKVPDYIFVATSTCGTLRGIADAAAERNEFPSIIAVDSAGSVVFGNEPGTRLIPGMGAGRPSDFLIDAQVSSVIHVSDQDCIAGCNLLLDRESILAGGSSGGIVFAIQQMIPRIPPNATIVALLPDSGERYLETIFNKSWVLDHFGEPSQLIEQ